MPGGTLVSALSLQLSSVSDRLVYNKLMVLYHKYAWAVHHFDIFVDRWHNSDAWPKWHGRLLRNWHYGKSLSFFFLFVFFVILSYFWNAFVEKILRWRNENCMLLLYLKILRTKSNKWLHFRLALFTLTPSPELVSEQWAPYRNLDTYIK